MWYLNGAGYWNLCAWGKRPGLSYICWGCRPSKQGVLWFSVDARRYSAITVVMMTSSNGNIFRVTGLLWGEIHWSPMDSPHKGQWHGALMFSLICAWTNGWANNRVADYLRRHRDYHDVTVMVLTLSLYFTPLPGAQWAFMNKCTPVGPKYH